MINLDVSAAQKWMANFAQLVSVNCGLLTELDRQIGDGDHGVNLNSGMRAAQELDSAPFDSAKQYLRKVGMILISTVGGASGPLYGSFFLNFAAQLPDYSQITVADLAGAFESGLAGIIARGKAELGDKTMVDALHPGVAALKAGADSDPKIAVQSAVAASEQGRDATFAMVARKGRASYLGGKIGEPPRSRSY